MTSTAHLTARSPEVVAFAGSRDLTNAEALILLAEARGDEARAHALWEAPNADLLARLDAARAEEFAR